MHINNIYKASWQISPNLKKEYLYESSVPGLEQECHINILRQGYINPDSQQILIDSSNSIFITVLAKSEFFTLTHVLLSNHPRAKDNILSIKGELDLNGLTIRKKKPSFSNEEKQRRSERMRKYHSK